jgi:ABC-2 type transport system permease protein
VFEGMRSILLEHRFDPGDLWWAFGLNMFYLAVGYAVFNWLLSRARDNGSLLQIGE